MHIKSHKDLDVYRMAFEAAMRVFHLSKKFPPEELYSLTAQIRHSSRSVCSSIAEGWRKRRYKKVFINKLTDAQQEAGETQTWLEFAEACNYIDADTCKELEEEYNKIIGKLNAMEIKADSFCFGPGS
jgi:four helix bundle protein